MRRSAMGVCSAAVLATSVLGCAPRAPKPGTVPDEALRAGVTSDQLVRPTEDYFHDMDDNVVDGRRPTFTQAEIEGRNM
jgi:hypothetical protein